jgi:UDP-GlcNAc:undecaprenyl-phosphate/decaprenyl-phosphate GlcNAc-1-phosphate transferase
LVGLAAPGQAILVRQPDVVAVLEEAGMLTAGLGGAVWPFTAVLAVLAAVTGLWAVPAFARFARQHGLTAANYKGEPVPTAAGLVLWALLAAGYAAGRCLLPAAALGRAADFAVAASGVTAAGLLDDLLGDRQVKGLPGHFAGWRRTGTLTTGLGKLVAAAGGALLVVLPQAAESSLPLLLPVQALLILLATNTLNLLDMRPGRASKMYLLAAAVSAAGYAASGSTGPQANGLWLAGLGPVTLGAAVLLVPDLRRRLMLGDTGANLLGFTAGTALTLALSPTGQLALCAALLLLHLYTLRGSLTAVIERNRLLHWLDEFGCPRERT